MSETTWKWIDTGSGPGAMQCVPVPNEDRAQHVREPEAHRRFCCQNRGSTGQTMRCTTAAEEGA